MATDESTIDSVLQIWAGFPDGYEDLQRAIARELIARRQAESPSAPQPVDKPRYEWIAEQMTESGMYTQSDEVMRMGRELDAWRDHGKRFAFRAGIVGHSGKWQIFEVDE